MDIRRLKGYTCYLVWENAVMALVHWGVRLKSEGFGGDVRCGGTSSEYGGLTPLVIMRR